MPRKLDESRRLQQRAEQMIPGGVSSPARAFASVGGDPPFIVRGQGAHMFDADGNEYIDYVGSWGPLILGHAQSNVIEAIMDAACNGTSFGASTPSEADLAEIVISAFPHIQKIRFVSSGTEATMSAIRLARAYTKRKYIVKFEGCYHGHADALLVKAGSGIATLGIPGSAGVPEEFTQFTLALPFNDIESLEQAFKKFPHQIACVIVEPIVGNMGCVPASGGFLAALRLITQREKAVLIFDEVMTGFRVAFGGAQERYNIQPDLTTLGKIIGGGLPVGAYGGSSDIMNWSRRSAPCIRRGRSPEIRWPWPPASQPCATCASTKRNLPSSGQTSAELVDWHHRRRQRCQRRPLCKPRGIHVHLVLPTGPSDRLALSLKIQHRSLRTLLPRHARQRRLLATFPIRSRIPRHSPHRRRHPENHRRRQTIPNHKVRNVGQSLS